MRTSKDLNRAIARLRKISRSAAEKRAQVYAESLLPDAARHRSVTDLAALAIMSLALYGAAATCIVEEHGVHAVQRIVDRWHVLLLEGTPVEHVFAQHVAYPNALERNRHALTRLPAPSVAAGLLMARDAVRSID